MILHWRGFIRNIQIFYFIIIMKKSIIILEYRHILLVKFLLRWYIVEINIIPKMIWLIYNRHSLLKFLSLIIAKICIWISFQQRIISRQYTLIFFFSITAEAIYFLWHTHLTLFFWKTSCHYNTVIFQNISIINICIINIIMVFFLKKTGKFLH